jgi:nucleoside-diphosphate-sugar epimerase
MSVLIVGCGYVGLEFARQWRASQQDPVYALTRSASRTEFFRANGIEPIVGNWQDERPLPPLPTFDTVMISVPHREDIRLGVRSHIVGLEKLLGSLPSSPRKLIYLSTTGVYGDAHDEVDELTPTQPTRIGPQIAVAAEDWLQQRHLPQLTIVRLAGIYGPGRIPLADKLRSGEPLPVPQSGWLNLVHVSDIANMLLKAVQAHLELPIYLFSDGHPVERLTFYRELARRCGVCEPRFVEPDPLSLRSQRAGAKRVNPQRLMQALEIVLQFPSYREGLADCLK